MEHVKLLGEMGTVNVSATDGMPVEHVDVLNQGSKPAPTSRAFQLQLGVAVCLAFVFFLGLCYRFISSRRSKIVGERRLASGGGEPGGGDDKGEGGEACHPGYSGPTEDDETELLQTSIVVQQPPSELQPGELAEGSRGHREDRHEAAAASLADTSQAPGAAEPIGEPRPKSKNEVRKERENLLLAVENISTLLQSGLEALNDDWDPYNSHWHFCTTVYEGLQYYLQRASDLFNEHNRRYGIQERIGWLNRVHSARHARDIAWNVLAAYASDFGLVSPSMETVSAAVDLRIELLIRVKGSMRLLQGVMERHREERSAETLAELNRVLQETSACLREVSPFLSRHASASVDILTEKIRDDYISLRDMRLQAMKMVSQT
ncbi:uncharacterized protein EMH_0020800 [Eimeria mitis]|uniref:Uncharacterized protein n=1 Tax=Eimeria mitis TaxID=44415 RepID=U6K0M3_9EIME|nr:uncharacterized protein EMH_0020800 [Eimeria mitis]CDJ29313.1 hypothetical protein, conserved [Eimeria mitis]